MVDLANLNTPAKLAEAKEFLNAVNSDLNDIKNKFFHIGYLLTKAYENRYFKILGYATITDLAEDKFDGLTKSVTYNLMQIYHEARDFKKPDTIAEKYQPYSQSQILAITRCKFATDDLLKRIKPSDSVSDIKKFISLWNKYTSKHSTTPKCNSVSDLLKQYGEYKETPKTEINPGRDLFQISKEIEGSEEKKEEFSTRVENLEAEAPVSGTRSEFGYPGTMANDDLIEYCLKYDVHQSLKFQIISFYEKHEPEILQFKEFVKSNYVNFGSAGAGFKFGYCKADNDNLSVLRSNGGKIVLSWGPVTARIHKLIKSDDYLDDREKDEYLKWKAKFDDVTIEPLSEEAPEEPEAEHEEDFDTYMENHPDTYVQGHTFDYEELEPKPRLQLTNRAYLSGLSDEQFVSELCLKIIGIFPMNGKSSQFMSAVQSKLKEWLSEIREVQ